MEHHFEQVDSIRLHYVEEGAGPLLLLLHGFPDFWRSWRHQIHALASAGFRVVAADLRGYNQSERPLGVVEYSVEAVAHDISALLQKLGGESPILIGHDWGGVIGWHLAMHQPDRLRGLIVLNAPHPAAFRREVSRLSSQLVRSSYAAFLQLPHVPESLLAAWDFAILKRALRAGPAPGDEELKEYLSVFSTPGALTAALNYYRAAARHPGPRPRRIDIPTLLLWGDRDPFLAPQLTRGLDPWVGDLSVVRLPDAAHWLHISHAAQVNQEILAFVRRRFG